MLSFLLNLVIASSIMALPVGACLLLGWVLKAVDDWFKARRDIKRRLAMVPAEQPPLFQREQ